MTRNTPEIAPYLSALESGDIEGFFQAVQPVSIDVGLMERSRQVAVLPAAFRWDDIGTWESLTRIRPQNADGSVMEGPGFLSDSPGCVVWSAGIPIIVDGVSNLVIVAANNRILVTTRERGSNLKPLLEKLPSQVRDLPS